MYIPTSFRMHNSDAMLRFMRENSFGILFSQVDGRPFATHLPFLVDAEGQTLYGHLAKANPHSRALDGADVLVVFQGPHAYISPSWYAEAQAVPTWNYVAVHAYGRCKTIPNRAKLHNLLRETVRYYEPDSPLLAHLDEDFYVQLEHAVVGLEIEITALEGKAKLSQNKSSETIRGIIEGLKRQHPRDSHPSEIANFMQKYLDYRTHHETP